MKPTHFLTIAFIAISMNFSCTAQANKIDKSDIKELLHTVNKKNGCCCCS